MVVARDLSETWQTETPAQPLSHLFLQCWCLVKKAFTGLTGSSSASSSRSRWASSGEISYPISARKKLWRNMTCETPEWRGGEGGGGSIFRLLCKKSKPLQERHKCGNWNQWNNPSPKIILTASQYAFVSRLKNACYRVLLLQENMRQTS